MQMEKITKDHLENSYLRKVEYFETGEGDDVIIRYFPGAGAKRSINRVKSLLSGRRGLISVGDELVDPVTALPPPDSEAEVLILKMISEYGLIEKIARRLVEENAEEARKQVEAYPYRKAKPDNPAAFLVQSIREKWPLPEKYLAALARKANETAVQAQTETERIADMFTEAIDCLQQAAANITASEKPALADACSVAESELSDLRSRIAAGHECLLAEVENTLTAAESRITEALWQSTDSGDIETMLKSARAELQKYEARMEPEVFNDTLRRHVTARLREQHRLPHLSLFYL
jgi:chemotaxis protein histidine kinase CheA